MNNSEILHKVLSTLLSISGRKTSQTHAVYVIDSVISRLKKEYGFLQHVSIKDTSYLEDEDMVTVMMDINSTAKNEMGHALYDLINNFNISLGKDAGHFFLKEFSRIIGDEYRVAIKDLGIDLSLMQLEQQIRFMSDEMLQSKMNNNIN